LQLIEVLQYFALFLYFASFVSYSGQMVERCFAVGLKQKIGIVYVWGRNLGLRIKNEIERVWSEIWFLRNCEEGGC